MCLHLDIIICHQSYQHCRKHQQSLSLSPPFLYIPILPQEYICGLKYKDKSVTIQGYTWCIKPWHWYIKSTFAASKQQIYVSKIQEYTWCIKPGRYWCIIIYSWYLNCKNTPILSNLVGTGASKMHFLYLKNKKTFAVCKVHEHRFSVKHGSYGCIKSIFPVFKMQKYTCFNKPGKHWCMKNTFPVSKVQNKSFTVSKVQNKPFAVFKVQKRLCCIKPGRYRCIKNTFVVSNPIPELPPLLHSLLQILHN